MFATMVRWLVIGLAAGFLPATAAAQATSGAKSKKPTQGASSVTASRAKANRPTPQVALGRLPADWSKLTFSDSQKERLAALQAKGENTAKLAAEAMRDVQKETQAKITAVQKHSQGKSAEYRARIAALQKEARAFDDAVLKQVKKLQDDAQATVAKLEQARKDAAEQALREMELVLTASQRAALAKIAAEVQAKETKRRAATAEFTREVTGKGGN